MKMRRRVGLYRVYTLYSVAHVTVLYVCYSYSTLGSIWGLIYVEQMYYL